MRSGYNLVRPEDRCPAATICVMTDVARRQKPAGGLLHGAFASARGAARTERGQVGASLAKALRGAHRAAGSGAAKHRQAQAAPHQTRGAALPLPRCRQGQLAAALALSAAAAYGDVLHAGSTAQAAHSGDAGRSGKADTCLDTCLLLPHTLPSRRGAG